MARGPQGRGWTAAPRALTKLEEAILREGERKIPVRQDGVTAEMPINEIIARKIAETAAKGSPHAQRLWTETYGGAELQRRQKIEEEIAFWRAYQGRERARIAAAERAGAPLPEPLPHPDDLEFDPETGVCFAGPATEAEARTTAETIARRDLLLLQHALDARALKVAGGPSAAAEPTSAMFLAILTNQSLPKRLQLSDGEMVSRLMAARTRSKRDLLKELHRGWKRLGDEMPRGTVLPPLDDTKEALSLLGEVLTDLRARPTLKAADYEDAARELILGARAIGQRRRAMAKRAAPPREPRDG
jgi:Family of unknown function (DUF5681)